MLDIRESVGDMCIGASREIFGDAEMERDQCGHFSTPHRRLHITQHNMVNIIARARKLQEVRVIQINTCSGCTATWSRCASQKCGHMRPQLNATDMHAEGTIAPPAPSNLHRTLRHTNRPAHTIFELPLTWRVAAMDKMWARRVGAPQGGVED